MDLDHFQKLCSQRVRGEKTELEFIREVRIALEPEPSEGSEAKQEKEVMRYLCERLVDVLEDHEMTEKDLLSQQIEAWLNG